MGGHHTAQRLCRVLAVCMQHPRSEAEIPQVVALRPAQAKAENSGGRPILDRVDCAELFFENGIRWTACCRASFARKYCAMALGKRHRHPAARHSLLRVKLRVPE